MNLLQSIQDNYGLTVTDSEMVGGYTKKTWKIKTSDNNSYVVKLLLDIDKWDLAHHQAEVEFAQKINNNLTLIKSVEFIPNIKGETLQVLDKENDNYYFLMKQEPIILKTDLSKEESINLGRLMRQVHELMFDFKNNGLGTSYFMREVKDGEEMKLIIKGFPDKGYKPYLDLMKPLDYEKLNLKLTVIHGDWHHENMSFTKPAFLFDLDCVCKAAAVEEIARAITHWEMKTEKVKDFYNNLVFGYEIFTDHEKELIPRLAIAQLYRKYAEFYGYNDPKHALEYKNIIPVFKKLFELL